MVKVSKLYNNLIVAHAYIMSPIFDFVFENKNKNKINETAPQFQHPPS